MRARPLTQQVEVVPARLVGILPKLRQSASLDAPRESFLGQLVRDRRQPVVVIDTAIVSVEGHTLGSRLGASGGLERVVGVESLAKFHVTDVGRKENGVSVLRHRPEAETPTPVHSLA